MVVVKVYRLGAQNCLGSWEGHNTSKILFAVLITYTLALMVEKKWYSKVLAYENEDISET